MDFTIKEIIEIAQFCGLEVVNTLGEDELDTEISIFERDGKNVMYFTDYPNEGCIELEK